MAFDRQQVEQVSEALQRAIVIDSKIRAVQQVQRITVEEANPDLEISNQVQVNNYLALLTSRRDNIINQVKTVVAGWT